MNININNNKITGGAASAPEALVRPNRPEAPSPVEPHMIRLGGLILVSVDGTAAEWGMTGTQFGGLLETLGVPVVQLKPGGRGYVSVYPLEYALFALGLPRAMKCTTNPNSTGCDATVTDVHFQLASLLYGTLTREAIRERVRVLAHSLGAKVRPPKRSKVAKRGRRKVLDPQ